MEEVWEWSPEELRAMSMEELMRNFARVALRLLRLTAEADAQALPESSGPN